MGGACVLSLPLSVPSFLRVTWHDHMPTMRSKSRSRTCQWTANMEGRRGLVVCRRDMMTMTAFFMCFCVQLQRFQDNLKQSPFQAEITRYQFRTLVEGTVMLEFSLSYKVRVTISLIVLLMLHRGLHNFSSLFAARKFIFSPALNPPPLPLFSHNNYNFKHAPSLAPFRSKHFPWLVKRWFKTSLLGK